MGTAFHSIHLYVGEDALGDIAVHTDCLQRLDLAAMEAKFMFYISEVMRAQSMWAPVVKLS
jgi:hypothetical protein